MAEEENNKTNEKQIKTIEKKIDMNDLKILNNKIKRIGDKLEILLNQHDENFKEEILNNIKILMEIEDLQELKEYILNFKKEKGEKICALVCLQYKYFMEVSEIVKKNNVTAEDYKELLFVKILCEN